MGKKTGSADKAHIKHDKFKDLNISPLEHHPVQGGTLKSPFSVVGDKVSMVSWRDHGLNEFLWAAILRTAFSQTEALAFFRRVTIIAREADPLYKETFISHSALSALSDEDFDTLMAPVLSSAAAKEALSALLYLDTPPDIAHWRRHLQPPSSGTSHTKILMTAVAKCMEHQSQEATDIRWLKVMYSLIVQQKMQFPESMAQRLEEWRLYPNLGDQRSVRPSIRANEIMLRTSNPKTNLPWEIPEAIASKVPPSWSDAFWAECMAKTECFTGDLEKPMHQDNKHYFDEIFNSYQALAEHFIQNTENSAPDARRDATYGLTLYSMFVALAISQHGLEARAEGRILLRTIVENYITLKFLAHRDNPTVWQQFRQYGTGQTKLAFLKNLREDAIPDFINLNDLHTYANEDLWQEYSDINLKPWSEKNLRAMATEAGIKDFYDKYYDWASAYVHGNWGAIRDTVFTVCLNPLHRFHRIPFIPRLSLQSALPDAAKILNLMLDLTSQLYPPFKPRIKHPAKEKAAKATKKKK